MYSTRYRKREKEIILQIKLLVISFTLVTISVVLTSKRKKNTFTLLNNKGWLDMNGIEIIKWKKDKSVEINIMIIYGSNKKFERK